MMQAIYIENKNKKYTLLSKYDGSQLRPLFSYENFNIKGPSFLAWVGACDVTLEHMVDFEDKIKNAKIKGDEMLHFIIEFFPSNLLSGVALQRLLASIVQVEVLRLAQAKKFEVMREGDDIYANVGSIKHGKLSISIASVSTVSTMIHFAMNITNKGTPVKTVSLSDLNINPRLLAENVMQIFCKEFESIQFATQKVKPLS